MVRMKIFRGLNLPTIMLALSLAFSIIFPAARAHTQESARLELSLDRAISLAVENSLALRQNAIDLDLSAQTANRIWAQVFPSISGNVGVGYSSPLFTSGGPALNSNRPDYSVGLGVTLGLNPGIRYTIENIRLAYHRNLLSFEDAVNQLEIQTTRFFFASIAERDSLYFLEDIFNLAEMHFLRNQISFDNGLLGERALMQSRLGLETARYNLIRGRSVYAINMGEFLALLGLPQDTDAHLLGEISVVRIEAGAEALIREHLPRRPDIVSRRYEIERLENAERQITHSARSPSLNLSVNWGSAGNRAFGAPFVDTVRGSATLSVPIDSWIPGTTGSQAVYRANQDVERARLDLNIATDAAEVQIRSLTANLSSSWYAMEVARLSLEIAERNYELTEEGFLAGTVESLALEDARNDLADARQRLLQSELSYFNMVLDLSNALNLNWQEITRNFGVQE
ncbi:MAG: TolC family protein [Spirochaetes bacterium]|nr:TolC family protein [Spirochaetota bacterium]